nr:MAG TPA: Cytosine specific methyltransferase [Caudoviricetes sp.]
MIHLGDITKIKGDNIPPVDVITFGSPCQDLSTGGKRAGLSGERSGLFMEAVRIIKEMMEATNGEYPQYAIWENVPGAFSSNKGEDFRAVLEELARIKEAGISIPLPDKSKWAKAGLLTGDDWSIAWRTMDAQYWGVPQRRLRISLVINLTGGRAEEILFEPESLRGHFAPGITPGQAAAGAVENGAGTADRAFTLKIRSGCDGGGKGALVQTEKSATLSTLQDQTLFVAEPTFCIDGKTSPTITGDHNRRITDYTSVIIEKIIRWIVRRLTPTECERLQGYPDGWTDLGGWVDSKGKTHKAADRPRYKALGNSIALPQWYYVLGGIADRLPDNATLGSLFDGIGGFPYVWAQLHAGRKELCVWASEIEEFPIAVTKKWFAGE